jgi:hypothetical protein
MVMDVWPRAQALHFLEQASPGDLMQAVIQPVLQVRGELSGLRVVGRSMPQPCYRANPLRTALHVNECKTSTISMLQACLIELRGSGSATVVAVEQALAQLESAVVQGDAYRALNVLAQVRHAAW